MTEKRFYLNRGEVGVLKIIDFKEDNEAIYRTTSESDMKIFVELLNKLHEENQYLKSLKWNQDCINEISTGIQQRQILEEENERLKSDNFNLNKSVECLDKIVKEQCMKIDWASECGVEWGKEFKNWNGYE